MIYILLSSIFLASILPPYYNLDMDMDQMGRIIETLKGERPDLDTSHFQTVFRIGVFGQLVMKAFEASFKEVGVSDGEGRVLVVLRTSGPPYTLSPTQIASTCGCTSGGLTKRLDLLEKRDLVRRLPSPNDRRGLLIKLTSKGKDLADRWLDANVKITADLESGYSETEARQLADLLRQGLSFLESRPQASSR